MQQPRLARWPGVAGRAVQLAFSLLALLVLCLTPGSATGQPAGSWQSVIAGVPVRYLFAAGPSLYALTPTELRRSDDGGDTWTPVTLPALAPDAGLGAVAVDPTDPDRLFVAGQAGLYRSLDGGASWLLLLPTEAVGEVEISPADPNLLYLAYTGSRPQYLRSRDGGESWTALPPPGYSTSGCTAYAPLLQPHPTDPRRLFRVAVCVTRASLGGPIEQSGDQGDTWTSLLRPAPDTPAGYPERLIGGEGAQPARFYLSASRRQPEASFWRLLRTDDDGATWQPLTVSRAVTVTSTLNLPWTIAYDPQQPDHLWLGRSEAGGQVQASLDAGATWTDLGPPTLGAVLYLRLSPDRQWLFAATTRGLLRTGAGG